MYRFWDKIFLDDYGTIFSVDLQDKKAEYKVVGNFTSKSPHEALFNIGNNLLIFQFEIFLAFQFDNLYNDCHNCYGNNNADQADLLLYFTETVLYLLLE